MNRRWSLRRRSTIVERVEKYTRNDSKTLQSLAPDKAWRTWSFRFDASRNRGKWVLESVDIVQHPERNGRGTAA